MKWVKRSESVLELELGEYLFRWLPKLGTVRIMGGALVASNVDTEEQATDAVRRYLEGVKAEGKRAVDALLCLEQE